VRWRGGGDGCRAKIKKKYLILIIAIACVNYSEVSIKLMVSLAFRKASIATVRLIETVQDIIVRLRYCLYIYFSG